MTRVSPSEFGFCARARVCVLSRWRYRCVKIKWVRAKLVHSRSHCPRVSASQNRKPGYRLLHNFLLTTSRPYVFESTINIPTLYTYSCNWKTVSKLKYTSCVYLSFTLQSIGDNPDNSKNNNNMHKVLQKMIVKWYAKTSSDILYVSKTLNIVNHIIGMYTCKLDMVNSTD